MVRRSNVCKKKYRFLAIAPVSWFYTRSNGLVFGKCNRATEHSASAAGVGVSWRVMHCFRIGDWGGSGSRLNEFLDMIASMAE